MHLSAQCSVAQWSCCSCATRPRPGRQGGGAQHHSAHRRAAARPEQRLHVCDASAPPGCCRKPCLSRPSRKTVWQDLGRGVGGACNEIHRDKKLICVRPQPQPTPLVEICGGSRYSKPCRCVCAAKPLAAKTRPTHRAPPIRPHAAGAHSDVAAWSGAAVQPCAVVTGVDDG